MGVTAPAEPRAIAERFDLGGPIESIHSLPGGHINDSYRVDVRPTGAVSLSSFLLQRVNPLVFPRPDLVMENVANVTRHLASRLAAAGVVDRHRRALVLIPTLAGGDCVTTADGACWRVFRFIAETVVHEHVRGPDDAGAAGRAFGEFLRLLADYDGPPLHETIPGFHDTVARFARLEAAVRADPCGRANAARPEIVAVMAVRGLVDRLPPLVAAGGIPVRIVHNDAKLANVLLDRRTNEALCVIDLDTVMPGLLLHDFGDLVRSVTSPTAEDEADLARVGVQEPLFKALAGGFLKAVGVVLTRAERDNLVFGGQVITLEQAVRFLTDHLEGDRYYRTSRPDHNLIRCRTQLKLFTTITETKPVLDAIVARLS